jgi:hypothetical protein
MATEALTTSMVVILKLINSPGTGVISSAGMQNRLNVGVNAVTIHDINAISNEPVDPRREIGSNGPSFTITACFTPCLKLQRQPVHADRRQPPASRQWPRALP